MIVLGSKRLIKSIRLRNFLSFGDNAEDIHLESLNVEKTGQHPWGFFLFRPREYVPLMPK